MKFFASSGLIAMLLLGSATALTTKSMTKDKTITQVVKLLQGMLDASKKLGDEERTAYAKYICDCDTRSTEYKNTIATSDTEISLLGSQISELKAEIGKLSTECAELQADMAANEAAQGDATNLRNNQNRAFAAEKQDLEAAIAQLKEALNTLAEVSADQTDDDATGMDHTKFMSGYKTQYNPVSLLKAKASLQTALGAASAFMDKSQKHIVASFMQAPFTGSYTSQSVEVMGILKNMKDTFESNLQQAIDQEDAQLKAFIQLISVKKAEYSDMSDSYDKKQGELSSKDETVGLKKTQKKDTEATMAEAEDFLATTETMCAAKKAEYEKRRNLQVGEEAAIAEAISILDSDEAFATFGTVSATSTGLTSFLQLKPIQKHASEKKDLRLQLVQTLQKVRGSKRLSKIVSLVQATNVFAPVLAEIQKMLALITAEAKTDKDNLDFCNSERTANDQLVANKTKSIDEQLKPTILDLTSEIENPEDGLKKQIADTEASLLQNSKDQKEAKDVRAEENLLYQKDMKNLADAKATLSSAIQVLDVYYKKLEKALQVSLLQKKNTPVPESDSAVLKMKGESKSGEDVISKLSFILKETEAEEAQATEDEGKAQSEFDRNMGQLQSSETSLQKALLSLESSLASTEQLLLSTKQELKTTEGEKAAAEAYLADIKPGCDFITKNFDLREQNRAEESKQLGKAVELIKGTPTYQTYEAQVHLESLGNCVSECAAPNEEKAKCKACLADVTVVAYCAGHARTPGCPGVASVR